MPIQDRSRWIFDCCALDGSHPPGSGQILNTGSKEFSYMINSARTCTFTMPVDNPRADWMYTNDHLIKVYRRNRYGSVGLQMVGDTVSMEEIAQNDQSAITVIAADPFFRLQKRALGVTTDSSGRGVPIQFGYGLDGVTLVPVDPSIGLQLILNYINGFNDTGINIGAYCTSISGNTSVGPMYNVYFGDLIQQTCAILGGPDFSIDPQEPSGTWPHTKIATLNFSSHLGSLNPQTPAVFEYGMGKHNVMAYDRLVTKEYIANVVVSLPSGFPSVAAAGDAEVIIPDDVSIGSIGEFDYVVDGQNLIGTGIRTALCEETLQTTAQAQQQLTFTPAVNCNLEYGTDYFVGDIVTARAYDKGSGSLRYNGTVRIYGVDITVDENDAESPTLTLIQSSVSGGGTIDY